MMYYYFLSIACTVYSAVYAAQAAETVSQKDVKEPASILNFFGDALKLASPAKDQPVKDQQIKSNTAQPAIQPIESAQQSVQPAVANGSLPGLAEPSAYPVQPVVTPLSNAEPVAPLPLNLSQAAPQQFTTLPQYIQPQPIAGVPVGQQYTPPNPPPQLPELLPQQRDTQQKATSRFTGTPIEQVQFKPKKQRTPRTNNSAQLSTVQTAAYLGGYVEPWRVIPEDERLEFSFDNAEVTALLWYIEEKFKVTFILDDALKPLPQGSKSLLGTKITFKTHKPLKPQEAWSIFVTILDMAGLSPVPGPTERSYRLLPSRDPKSPQDATRAPIPLFIGVDPTLIPDDDSLIRYVYYVEHANLTAIRAALDALRSATAPEILPFVDLNALIITDKARVVKNMLALAHELDQANVHETLRVVKLKHVDAERAAKIYEALTKKDPQQGIARIIGTNKTSISEYFSRSTRIIPDARSNALIILSPRASIDAVEHFVVTYLDVPDTRSDEPRYVYRLKFLDAKSAETLLQEVLKFKADSNAAKTGGVRDGDKYFKHISVVAEPTTNSLIISGEYDDYVKVYNLLQEIDIEQPQVVLKVFLVSVDLTNDKAFGVQMRNKIPGPNGLLGNNVNYQSSGLAGLSPATAGAIVENTAGSGAQRLLGNLVSLASSAVVGSTIITLGSDTDGVWGILNMLAKYTKTEILDNPFVITTNKFPAKFTIGENRRVPSSTIFSATTSVDTFENLTADLQIKITPQISRDGLITLDVYIGLKQFLDTNPNSINGDYTDRALQTTAIVSNHEMLALGGLIREQIVESTTQVPVLGSIPLIGWLFKNRNKTINRTSLLVLILPEVIQPAPRSEELHIFTRDRLRPVLDSATEIQKKHSPRDPVHRWFLNDANPEDQNIVDRFAYMSDAYTQETEKAYKKNSQLLADKLPPIEMSPQEAYEFSKSESRARKRSQTSFDTAYQKEILAAEQQRTHINKTNVEKNQDDRPGQLSASMAQFANEEDNGV